MKIKEETKNIHDDAFIDEPLEHIVSEGKPDQSLCGLDVSDEPWHHGGPVCVACSEIMRGGNN